MVWRGPVIAGAVKQFWTDVVWGDVDYMFVDMPPGTGDVPLTVFQSLPVDGIIVVSSPQELVSMIVEKAINMANLMKIPVLGLIENYSYVKCPDCGREIRVFGESKIEETAERLGVPLLARIPLDPELAKLSDNGQIELLPEGIFEGAADEGVLVNAQGRVFLGEDLAEFLQLSHRETLVGNHGHGSVLFEILLKLVDDRFLFGKGLLIHLFLPPFVLTICEASI